ncbi:MAG: class I SAM-dependent methyltransferase [Gemmataceae bacterium]|nr:class I SAM-dependent methyltransferase [Gemmataceae bacterium]
MSLLKSTLRRWLWKLRPARPTHEALFTRFYETNTWQDARSVSGPGSNAKETAVVRQALPMLFAELGVRSVLDIPCGDFHWMAQVELRLQEYIGADIVEPLIRSNQERYGRASQPKISFAQWNLLTASLPRVDLVLCRDCLVHLPLAEVAQALAQIKASGSTYLLTTTFPNHARNWDIAPGDWRPLNLQMSPFALPPPCRLLNEGNTQDGGRFADKSLGLWWVEDL